MKTERLLYGACTSGLGDRLLVLAGSLRIARLSGRRFLLYWRVNDRCGAAFRSLFDNEIAEVTEADFHRLLWTNSAVKFYNAWLDRPGPAYNKIASDGDPAADIVVIKCWNYPMLDSDKDNAALQTELRSQLLALKPNPRLLAEVDNFKMPEKVIGVHIRRGDAIERFGQSKEDYFIALMEAVIRREPACRFFLASDVAEVEACFERRFAGRVVSFPKGDTGRARQRGMEESLIDLLLLSSSRAIIGNLHSSFTRVAGLLGGRPMVQASETNASRQLDDSVDTLVAGLR